MKSIGGGLFVTPVTLEMIKCPQGWSWPSSNILNFHRCHVTETQKTKEEWLRTMLLFFSHFTHPDSSLYSLWTGKSSNNQRRLWNYTHPPTPHQRSLRGDKGSSNKATWNCRCCSGPVLPQDRMTLCRALLFYHREATFPSIYSVHHLHVITKPDCAGPSGSATVSQQNINNLSQYIVSEALLLFA